MTTPPAKPDATAPPETLDIRAYLGPIWRRRALIGLLAIVAGAGTYVISSRQPKRYVAETSIFVRYTDPAGSVAAGQASSPPAPTDLTNLSMLLDSDANTAAVYRSLRLRPSTSNVITVGPQSGSTFIDVTVTSDSPTVAAALANGFAQLFLTSRRQQDAAAARRVMLADEEALAAIPVSRQSGAARTTIREGIQAAKDIEAHPIAGASQGNPAMAPLHPASPQPKRDGVFGLIVGLVLGIVIAYGLELLDRRLILVSTIESLYGRPVIGVLPHAGNPTPMADGHAMMAPEFTETFRALRVNVELIGPGRRGRSVLVTSGLPGEGKSTVARGLALTYAEAGERVLMVDADLRRPIMDATFGVDTKRGLSHVLQGQLQLSDAALHTTVANGEPAANGNGTAPAHAVPHGSVDVLAHGELVDNPLALLSSAAWATLVEGASSTYDVVIIDSAPLLAVADTVPLLAHVDLVLLVARLGMTTRDSARRVTTLLARVPQASLAGVVANDMRSEFLSEGYDSYYHGYGRYASRGGNRNGPGNRGRRPFARR